MEFKRDARGRIILTKDEAIKLHRDMWAWIADRIEAGFCKPDVTKAKYFTDVLGFSIDDIVNEEIDLNCFLCHYAYSQVKPVNKVACDYCPLDWGGKTKLAKCIDKNEYDDREGLYQQYMDAIDNNEYEEAERLARKIATLKEKDD